MQKWSDDGRGKECGNDAELSLHRLEGIVKSITPGEEKRKGEESDHERVYLKSSNSESSPTLTLMYRPHLTQPFWSNDDQVNKDGHLVLDRHHHQESSEVGKSGGIGIRSIIWFQNVYNYVSLLLWGILVLGYFFVFINYYAVLK